MPLPDASVDVVSSNCVINLSGDKRKTIAEAARVLRPGGRFAISDVIAGPDMDEQSKADMAAWTGCIASALFLMAAGYTLRELMEYMGHSSLQATERYVKLLPPLDESNPADRLNAFLRRRASN